MVWCGNRTRFKQQSHCIPVQITCECNLSHRFCMAQIAPHPHQNRTGPFFPQQNWITWVFTPMRSDSANCTVFFEPFLGFRYFNIDTCSCSHEGSAIVMRCGKSTGIAANPTLHQCEPGLNLPPSVATDCHTSPFHVTTL